ncbi:MAG TPA: dienelactone hydrolase family protein, partial [Aggregatilineales bacterium]|nr:dienelactone hydrolase family protein [Aggregatilineales bacterium]
QIHTWEAKFKQYGKINQMVIYPGAAHAFFNDTESSYIKAAATDAWQRTLDWFSKYLAAGAESAATAAATPAATISATSTS